MKAPDPSQPWALDFMLLAAVWGASFLFMHLGVLAFGPLATAGVAAALETGLFCRRVEFCHSLCLFFFCPAVNYHRHGLHAQRHGAAVRCVGGVVLAA